LAKEKDAVKQTDAVKQKEAVKPKKVEKQKGAVVADKPEPAATAPSAEAPPAAPKPSTKSMKIPKLLPKNKSRLPRKQKKAQQKAAGRL